MVAYKKWERSLLLFGFLLTLVLVLLGEYGKYLRLEDLYPMKGFTVSSIFVVQAPQALPLWGYLLFHTLMKVLWFLLVYRVMVILIQKYGGYVGILFGGFLLVMLYLGGDVLKPVMTGNSLFALRLFLLLLFFVIHIAWTLSQRKKL